MNELHKARYAPRFFHGNNFHRNLFPFNLSQGARELLCHWMTSEVCPVNMLHSTLVHGRSTDTRRKLGWLCASFRLLALPEVMGTGPFCPFRFFEGYR